MKQILLILLTFLTIASYTQNINVKSFKALPNDMEARIQNPKTDNEGVKCAIIKVVTTETGFAWDIGMFTIVDIRKETGEYWLYVPYGTKAITIKHDKLGVLRNYVFGIPIKKACVYELVLTTAKVITTIEEIEILSEWVVLNTTPEGADVYINDKHKGQTPFEMEMKEGEYNYSLQKTFYKPNAGVFTLSVEGGKKIINETLEADFGYANIKSLPIDGASIFINDKAINKTTPFITDKLKSGEYKITINKDFYNSSTESFVIGNGDTTEVNLIMQANFGYANIISKPENGASISLDGKTINKSTPFKTDKLIAGEHTVTVKKDMYKPSTKTFTVGNGKTTDVNVNMDANFGSLKITSIPESGAKITLDQVPLNKTTPHNIEQLISGEHTISIRKNWYEPKRQTFTITDNENKKLEIQLIPTFGEVTITTEPNADIYIDNNKVANGKHNCRLIAGVHTIEAKKEKHHTAKQKIDLQIEKTEIINLIPEPKQGILKIQTTPFDAEITLNGKAYGTTPKTIRKLLIGEYTVKLEKPGYGTITEIIEVKENEELKMKKILDDKVFVLITSNPKNAQIFINGQEVGNTPKSIPIKIGKNKIKLKKYKYVEKEQNINVTEETKTLDYKLLSDKILVVENKISKTKKILYYSLGISVSSLALGSYLQYSSEQHFIDYKNSTDLTEATSLHTTINNEILTSYIAFGIGSVCLLSTAYFGIRLKKLKKEKTYLSFIPTKNGVLLSMKLIF